MPPEVMSAAFTLLGVLIGGVIAYFAQLHGARIAARSSMELATAQESNRYRDWLLDRRHNAYVSLIDLLLEVQYGVGESFDFVLFHTIKESERKQEKSFRRMTNHTKISRMIEILNRERGFLAPQVGLEFHRFISGYSEVFIAHWQTDGDALEQTLGSWCEECHERIVCKLEESLPLVELKTLRENEIMRARDEGKVAALALAKRAFSGEQLMRVAIGSPLPRLPDAPP